MDLEISVTCSSSRNAIRGQSETLFGAPSKLVPQRSSLSSGAIQMIISLLKSYLQSQIISYVVSFLLKTAFDIDRAARALVRYHLTVNVMNISSLLETSQKISTWQ